PGDAPAAPGVVPAAPAADDGESAPAATVCPGTLPFAPTTVGGSTDSSSPPPPPPPHDPATHAPTTRAAMPPKFVRIGGATGRAPEPDVRNPISRAMSGTSRRVITCAIARPIRARSRAQYVHDRAPARVRRGATLPRS